MPLSRSPRKKAWAVQGYYFKIQRPTLLVAQMVLAAL